MFIRALLSTLSNKDMDINLSMVQAMIPSKDEAGRDMCIFVLQNGVEIPT